MTNTPQKQPKNRKVFMFLAILMIASIGYFGNRALQTYLGQQALVETGLNVLTLEQALIQAKAKDKLVLADMSAIWCPTCRKLDNTIFADQQVQTAIEQDFIYTRIEYDSPQGKTFMQQYEVRGFPTLLVLNKTGQKLARLPLTFTPRDFIQNLHSVAKTQNLTHE